MAEEVLYSKFPDAGLAVDKLDPRAPAIVVAADQKHPVLVTISDWQGKYGIDVRQLYENKKAGKHDGLPVFSRTRQGARVPIEEFEDLVEFLLSIADGVAKLKQMQGGK